MKYQIDDVIPEMFKKYISLDETTGNFECTEIFENDESNFPEKILIQISDGHGAEAIALFKINNVNNHKVISRCYTSLSPDYMNVRMRQSPFLTC